MTTTAWLLRGTGTAAIAALVLAVSPAAAWAQEFLLYFDVGLSIPAAPP